MLETMVRGQALGLALRVATTEIDDIDAVGNRLASQRREIAQLAPRGFEQIERLRITAAINLVHRHRDAKAALPRGQQPRFRLKRKWRGPRGKLTQPRAAQRGQNSLSKRAAQVARRLATGGQRGTAPAAAPPRRASPARAFSRVIRASFANKPRRRHRPRGRAAVHRASLAAATGCRVPAHGHPQSRSAASRATRKADPGYSPWGRHSCLPVCSCLPACSRQAQPPAPLSPRQIVPPQSPYRCRPRHEPGPKLRQTETWPNCPDAGWRGPKWTSPGHVRQSRTTSEKEPANLRPDRARPPIPRRPHRGTPPAESSPRRSAAIASYDLGRLWTVGKWSGQIFHSKATWQQEMPGRIRGWQNLPGEQIRHSILRPSAMGVKQPRGSLAIKKGKKDCPFVDQGPRLESVLRQYPEKTAILRPSAPSTARRRRINWGRFPGFE